MNRAQTLKKAKRVLSSFYLKNKDGGVLGIYIWGSVLTSDFNPQKSDIDSVAFVKERVSIKREALAKKLLAAQLLGLSIRFVYPSELKGGKTKGHLARVMDYRLMMLDIPHWQHVAGQKINIQKLGLRTIETDEVISLILFQIYNRNFWEIRHVPGQEKYFIKAVFRLCFHLERRGKPNHAFSYSYVKRHATSEVRSVVSRLSAIKQSGYQKEVFEKNLNSILVFLEKCKKKYGLAKQ